MRLDQNTIRSAPPAGGPQRTTADQKNQTQKQNPIVEREKQIQKFWEDNKIFKKTLEATKDNEPYSFYDGPPFATGTPHYGHLVASIMKDVVPRYQTMKGFYVERKWGWDCHGLPIENIIEKELNLKSRKDIENMGVEKFNACCRESVLRYADEWKKIIPRLGRWVDMENDYKTMEPWYMESIWWVFKTLWDKKLIYEGYKSMHVCPRCETTLSNFEVTQGYKDVKDLSVTVKFELEDEPDTYILAWTTTPWTLIGNVALAIGKDIDYVLINHQNDKTGKQEFLILAKERLNIISSSYEIVKEFKGEELIGKKYIPLFNYYHDIKLPNKENLYLIIEADFVSTEDGTGVVHIAPAFGEEDMVLGEEKKLSFIQHVDMSGRFMPEVTDFAGLEVKPKEDPTATDKKIIEFLGDKILMVQKYEHSYPHCWRCDTPLLNYAASSWFMRVTEIKKNLIDNNNEVNWVPAHLKEGRFGKWLAEAKDWAISRSRYWGAPLPVWQSNDGDVICVGSIAELEELSGQKVQDLHKNAVDHIEIEKNGKIYKRIPEVLDCWFESGSMPYAQMHYPFENKDKFESSFPAQFIAEGVDQTRGWFYTLMVLSTALFDKPAFFNVAVNGIVLAEDGNKMSKRLANYPEPGIMMEKYGADALRFYLLSSPVMIAENLNFSEAGVKEALQKVIMLAGNIVKFYKLYETDEIKNREEKAEIESVLDRWLLAKLNVLIIEVTDAMEKYNLSKAARPIQTFIDELSTWWLRRSRDRFKSDDKEDKKQALKTFNYVLLELSKVMAPFTPFIAEYIYKEAGGDLESVHLENWPEADKDFIDEDLLIEMEQAKKIVEYGLAARASHGIKVRQPLAKLKVKSKKAKIESNDELIKIIGEEVNVKEVAFYEGMKDEVELDLDITVELKVEGASRELIRLINSKRKKQGLSINDKIKVLWYSSGEVIKKVFNDMELTDNIKQAVIAVELDEQDNAGQEVDINGEKISIEMVKV